MLSLRYFSSTLLEESGLFLFSCILLVLHYLGLYNIYYYYLMPLAESSPNNTLTHLASLSTSTCCNRGFPLDSPLSSALCIPSFSTHHLLARAMLVHVHHSLHHRIRQ